MRMMLAIARFGQLAERALGEGMDAALVMGRDGRVVARAGAFNPEDELAVAGVVTRGFRGASLVGRLLRGETVAFVLGEREVSVAVAARCVFLVLGYQRASCALTGKAMAAARERAEDIVRDLVRVARPRQRSGGGGPSSPPDELQLVEIGVTIPGRGKA